MKRDDKARLRILLFLPAIRARSAFAMERWAGPADSEERNKQDGLSEKTN
jgi:hypothetical protein